MRTLLDALNDANARRVAIGHFNASELVALKAEIGVARELDVPVIIGFSEGERAFLSTRRARRAAPRRLDSDSCLRCFSE